MHAIAQCIPIKNEFILLPSNTTYIQFKIYWTIKSQTFCSAHSHSFRGVSWGMTIFGCEIYRHVALPWPKTTTNIRILTSNGAVPFPRGSLGLTIPKPAADQMHLLLSLVYWCIFISWFVRTIDFQQQREIMFCQWSVYLFTFTPQKSDIECFVLLNVRGTALQTSHV